MNPTRPFGVAVLASVRLAWPLPAGRHAAQPAGFQTRAAAAF